MTNITEQITVEFLKTLSVVIPVSAVVMGAIWVVLRRVMQLMDRETYNREEHRAVLSEMRASYESRIADLSREMVATRARWEDANHLLISGQRHQPDKANNSAIDTQAFLSSYGIDPSQVTVEGKRIFFLTPFAEEEQDVFRTVQGVCHKAGFSVIRGDEERAEGDILQQVVKGVVASRIVIANISSRNPNVFFELGIAMALGKPTLLLSDTMEDVPFDVQTRRIIVFSDLNDLRSKLGEALLQTMGSLLDKRD